MYTEFFHLKEVPFSIAPDPRFFFMSDRHKEALAHLTYGLKGAGGFVMLTGEVGTGKTTVSRALIQALPESTQIACVLNPTLNERELLAAICDEFDITYDKQTNSLKVLFDALYQYLLTAYQTATPTIVLVDEAQLLSTAALEQLRLLTNLQLEHKKLLHIVLIGQPELQQKLKLPELRQLAQRITARYHLLPLTYAELESYVAYRLSIASGNPGLFSSCDLKRIHRYTQGVPRLINLLCDKTLYLAYTAQTRTITEALIDEAAIAVAVTDTPINLNPSVIARSVLLASLLVVGGISAYYLLPDVMGMRSPTPIIVTSVAEIAEGSGDNDAAEMTVLTLPAEETDPTSVTAEAYLSDKALALHINRARTPDVAMQHLYRQWGVEIAPGAADCRGSSYANLRCLQKQITLSELTAYNFPAVVTLRDKLGDPYFATLVSYTAQGAQLLIDNAHIAVSPAWFEKYWNGEVTLFWKAPRAFKKTLKQNDRGEIVRWLDASVSEFLGVEASGSQLFDYELTKKVFRFQRKLNLTADGIVGARTMMALVQRVDSKVPRLDVISPAAKLEVKPLARGGQLSDPMKVKQLPPIEYDAAFVTITASSGTPEEQSVIPEPEQAKVDTTIIPVTIPTPGEQVADSQAPRVQDKVLMNKQLADEHVSNELLAKFNRALSATREPSSFAPKETEDSNNAIPITDLPDDLLGLVPRINYSSHIYSSKPQNRTVRLNNRDLREGSWLTEDVEVLEILQNEVIMRVAGQSFSMNALSDWRP